MFRIFHHYISKLFLSLFVVELCVFFAAMYFGNQVRFLYAKSWYSETHIILASLFFAISTSLCLSGIGLYRRNLGWNDYELMSRTSVGLFASTLIIVCFYYAFPGYIIGRSVLAYSLMFAFLGMMICRLMFKKLVGRNVLRRKILVIGSGKNAKKVLQSNTGYIHKGFDIVGCLATPNGTVAVDEGFVLNAKRKMVDIVNQYQIDEIVIALDDRRKEMPVNELLDCKISGTEIVDLLSFYEREKAHLDLDNLHPSWMVFSDGFTQSSSRIIIKRIIDIVASLSLFILTFPVMLLTALAICIESGFRKPIFYRQIRVGEKNQNFEVLKFRSMRTDAENQGIRFTKENDNRITKVGAFIRKYRIDELPQIFNVLKGEMSFVGPRPERPGFVEKYNESIPYYRERHRVKPGITGWAQLWYPYGKNQYDAIQKLQYDLYYVKNYSLFLDLNIILHTVEVILWGKGAR